MERGDPAPLCKARKLTQQYNHIYFQSTLFTFIFTKKAKISKFIISYLVTAMSEIALEGRLMVIHKQPLEQFCKYGTSSKLAQNSQVNTCVGASFQIKLQA